MIQRGSQVVIKMLSDVKQRTIKPIITETIAPGAVVMTDEYDIYAKLPKWAMVTRRSVTANASSRVMKTAPVFAKSTSTRSKASGHYCVRGCAPRGISRERLPFYLGFFEFMHNVRKRGKALLGSLLALLLN